MSRPSGWPSIWPELTLALMLAESLELHDQRAHRLRRRGSVEAKAAAEAFAERAMQHDRAEH
jgi:hypothetical protein